MNIIHTLTLAQMRQNKRRTLVTLVGVVLSVAMVTAVLMAANSFLDLMYRQAVRDSGSWYGTANQLPSRAAATLARDERVDQVGYSQHWGLTPFAGGEQDGMQGISLSAVDATLRELMHMQLLEGAWPQKPGELAIPQELARQQGWQVGTRVELGLVRCIDRRVSAEGWEEQFCNINGSFNLTPSGGRTIQRVGRYACTVTAIVDPGAYGVKQFYQWWPCYTAFGQGGVNDGVVEAYFTTKKAGAVFDVLDALEQRILAEPEYMGTARGSRINRSVLLYYGVDTPDSLMLYAMYALVGVVLAIVMVGALSLVQSAFSISLAERTRTLGMLASVGATRRQKRQSVFFEAAVLGAIGIPAGLAAGCMGIGVTLYLLDGTVRGLLGMAEPLRLAVRPGYLLAAAAFSALTLLLSAWLPAVRASRVSPVDAMRGAGQVKLTAKHLRTRPITRKLFGFEGVLALKNAKRNRSRYRSILFSLTLSVVLLVSVSGFSSYMRAAMDMRYDTRQNWQYTAELTGEFSGWPSGIIARLEGLEGAGDDSDVLVHLQPGDLQVATVDLPTGVQAELKRQAEWQHSSFPEHYPSPEPGVSSTLSPTLLVLEDELFAEWAGPAVQLDSSRLSCVLAGQVVYRAYDGRFYEFTHNTPLQPGDSLPLVQEGVKENLYIAAASQKAAPLVPQLVYELGKFYVVTNQTVFRQFCARAQQAGQGVRFSVLVGYPAPSDKEALQKNVSQVAHELTGYESLIYGEAMHDTDLLSTLSRLMEVFLYGFVALIGLVCAANIFNTVTTGIALRGREYAMLKSVGITPKKFRHMVRLESLFYALKALAYGLPISLLILWGEYRAIRINFFFRFTLPWVGILLAGTLALTVTGASAFYAQRQLGRTSIVDTLKTELC